MKSVDYIILYVEDLKRSVDFYRDVVGLTFKFSEAGYAEFVTEGTKFALFERSKLPELLGREPSPPGLACEVAFIVADVDAAGRSLGEAGVEILSGPVDRPWGHRTVHFHDPDSNVVELAQEIPRGAK